MEKFMKFWAKISSILLFFSILILLLISVYVGFESIADFSFKFYFGLTMFLTIIFLPLFFFAWTEKQKMQIITWSRISLLLFVVSFLFFMGKNGSAWKIYPMNLFLSMLGIFIFIPFLYFSLKEIKNKTILLILFLFFGFLLSLLMSPFSTICSSLACSAPEESNLVRIPCNSCTIVKPIYIIGILNLHEVCSGTEILYYEQGNLIEKNFEIRENTCSKRVSFLGFQLKG